MTYESRDTQGMIDDYQNLGPDDRVTVRRIIKALREESDESSNSVQDSDDRQDSRWRKKLHGATETLRKCWGLFRPEWSEVRD